MKVDDLGNGPEVTELKLVSGNKPLEQTTAGEAIIKLAPPELGDMPMQGVFPRLSSTPGRVRHVGPELGEHNDEVYRGLLGLGDGDMEELTAASVI